MNKKIFRSAISKHQLSRDQALNRKIKICLFLTGTCRLTFKNYFVIAHLGKKMRN